MFVSAGDNVGASTFISSSQEDAPTIEALNLMGLDAGAVGNHEFDRGYDWLADPATHGIDGDGLARWTSLGANVGGAELAASPSSRPRRASRSASSVWSPSRRRAWWPRTASRA